MLHAKAPVEDYVEAAVKQVMQIHLGVSHGLCLPWCFDPLVLCSVREGLRPAVRCSLLMHYFSCRRYVPQRNQPRIRTPHICASQGTPRETFLCS
jgi:hypothetical protein